MQIHITGADDVHHFYTSEAAHTLGDAPAGVKVALVHSAELAPIADEHGFGPYLSGHTHGGQVCLPGGHPIVTRMRGYRKYASGLWRCGEMIGYTSTGVGVASPTVRFNTRGEVVWDKESPDNRTDGEHRQVLPFRPGASLRDRWSMRWLLKSVFRKASRGAQTLVSPTTPEGLDLYLA